jgi:hypothetical protein
MGKEGDRFLEWERKAIAFKHGENGKAIAFGNEKGRGDSLFNIRDERGRSRFQWTIINYQLTGVLNRQWIGDR